METKVAVSNRPISSSVWAAGKAWMPDIWTRRACPQQLAEQTGLDLRTATGSLQHVFEMLAGSMDSGQP